MPSSSKRETITYEEYRKLCPLVRLLKSCTTNGNKCFNAGAILIVLEVHTAYTPNRIDAIDSFGRRVSSIDATEVEYL